MKNLIYTTLCLCLATQIAVAKYSGIDREVINTNEVPEVVTDAQKKQFRTGFVTKWKIHKKNEIFADDSAYYMATFKKQGRLGNYAYYTPEGELLAYSLFVDNFDLPENIQEYCFRNYNNARIKAAEFIDLEKPQQFIYRVRLNADGLLTYIYFNTNGNPIDKFKLPREIFLFI